MTSEEIGNRIKSLETEVEKLKILYPSSITTEGGEYFDPAIPPEELSRLLEVVIEYLEKLRPGSSEEIGKAYTRSRSQDRGGVAALLRFQDRWPK